MREADDDGWLVEMAQAGEVGWCGLCGDGDKQTQEMSRQGFRLEDEGIMTGIMADHFGTRCNCDASLDRRRLSIWASISCTQAVRKCA